MKKEGKNKCKAAIIMMMLVLSMVVVLTNIPIVSAGVTSTYVNDITPYWQDDVPEVTIYATDNIGNADSMTLYYRYDEDNSSWTPTWTEWVGDNNPRPDSRDPPYNNDFKNPIWVWNFDCPDGTGYYEFYTIGENSSDYEDAPTSADASCHVTKTSWTRFGYWTIGMLGEAPMKNPDTYVNWIRGTNFICPSNGFADSITWWFEKKGTNTVKMKCAIYEYEGASNTLVKQTEEKTISGSYLGWVVFNFEGSKPYLTASTAYILEAWAEGGFPYYDHEITGHDLLEMPYNYTDNFPTEFVDPTYPDNDHGFAYSIYCRYTETPNAPTSFTATTYSTTQINLAWSKGLKADKTYIERKSGSVTTPWAIGTGVEIYNGTGTSYSDISLDCNTTYYYQAWSYNNTNNVYSGTLRSDNDITDPCPSGLTITNPNPINESIGILIRPTISATVTNSDSNESVVDFYYSLSDSPYNWLLFNHQTDKLNVSVSTNATFATQYNTKYWWKMTANDTVDNTTSDLWEFTTIDYTPDAPVLTGATAGRTKIELTWTKDTNADKTYIEWDSVNDTSWNRGDHNNTLINSSTSPGSHTGLTNGVTYYYKAWSWNNTQKVWSTTGSNVIDATTTNAIPSIQGVIPSDGSSNVDLQPACNVTVKDFDGDLLDLFFYEKNSTSWLLKQSYNDKSSGYNAIWNKYTNATAFDTEYTWCVNITDGYDWTNETYTFTTRAIYDPDEPTSFDAFSYNRNQINLTWTKGASNVSKTYIERNATAVTSWVKGTGTLIYNGTGISFSDTGRITGIRYYYQAWSWNEIDHTFSDSYVSDDAIASNDYPSIGNVNPLDDAIDVDLQPDCKVTVTDNDPGDTLDVYFYEYNSTGSWLLKKTYNDVTSGTSVTWSKYENATSYLTTYYWSVNVTDGYNWTNVTYSFTTLSQYRPAKPTGFSASASSTSAISLSWTKGNKADTTMILYKEGSTAPEDILDGLLVYNGTGTSAGKSGLKAGTRYSFSAWSWNSTGELYSLEPAKASAITNTPSGGDNGNGGTPGDTTPPTIPTNVKCTTLPNDNTPSFSWTKSTDTSGISGYYIKIDTGTDTWVGNVTSWTSTNVVADGAHTFYVKAADAIGNVGSYGSCSFTINITVVGKQPIADAGGPYTGSPNQTITFDGSKSTDSDGNITGYRWDWTNDGTYDTDWLTTATTTHAYPVAGKYTINLQVKDNTGATAADTAIVDIIIDTDADDDGLSDALEAQLGSNPNDKSDAKAIIIDGKTYYLVDTNKDGQYNTFYNPTTGKSTPLTLEDGKYKIDVDGDGKIDYLYNPASGEISIYKPDEGFPLIYIVIIVIIIVIILIIAVLYKTGYISIEKVYEEEEKKK